MPGPVLLVDDDTVSRHVLGQALTQAKLDHVTAATGAEALAQVERVKPSLVLLDLVMPPPDGYQILRILRARPETRDLPIVVLTAIDADDEIAKAFEAGADDFVRKPFKPVELVARVRGQLRLRSAMVELAQREKDAQLVAELTQALASNLDFRSILFTVVRRIAEVAEVDRVSIVLVREPGDVGYVVAASDDEQLRDLPIDLTKYPEIREVLESGKPLVVSDASKHPLFDLVRSDGVVHRAGATGGFSSLSILPIVFEGKPMGVLFLRARRERNLGDRELSLCRTIASAMAIALRNARVMQTLRDQTQKVTVARFEAERRLRSLQRYVDFFESSSDGIVVIDTDGNLLFSNPKAHSITGYAEADLQGKKLGDIFAPGDAGLASMLKESFARGLFPQGVDIRIARTDGEHQIVNVNFSSVLREDGAILCSFRDVTQERAVEAELVKTKDFLQRVIDASVDGIISADRRGHMVLVNRAAERMCGRSASALVGEDVRMIYPKGTAERLMRLIREGGGHVEGLRAEVNNAHGELVPVLFSGSLIYDRDMPVGSVGIFTDLREKVRMERRLEEAQQLLISRERQAAIAELAGAAAHELNQPLMSVMNYAALLRRILQGNTRAVDAANVIETEADRMAEIVRKIGKITKYETKSYVGGQKILDLDRASDEASSSVDGSTTPEPPKPKTSKPPSVER